MQKATLALLGLVAIFSCVSGHGRLWEPAGRGTLWRQDRFKSYNPAPDYDDTQHFCDGFHVQYSVNGGKCGICGDSYSDPEPRAHEGGGIFGRGIITGTYTAGQVFTTSVQLTASHLGYFEFRLCPQNNPLVPATQECLDKHVLQLADGSGTRYPIPTFDSMTHNVTLRLPAGVTCNQCALQWHYNTGNSHGYCADLSYRLGCGDQETFRSCADITIN